MEFSEYSETLFGFRGHRGHRATGEQMVETQLNMLFSDITFLPIISGSNFDVLFYFLSVSTSSVSPVPINHSENSESSHLKKALCLCVIKNGLHPPHRKTRH